MTQSERDYRVPALMKGLAILEMFDEQNKVLSTQDFAEHLGVSASSIYRVVMTLTELQYLRKIARNTYELGPANVSRGFAYLAGRDIIDVSASHLNQLRDATSVSCHLAVRDGREALYIYRALASQRLSVNVPVGTRLPCHSCAVGRVLLGGLDDSELERLYFGQQLDGVGQHNPQSLPALRQRIASERRQGFAVNQSDFATAIAAPIRNYSNQIVAAINLSGPDIFIQGAEINREVTEQLLAAASAISRDLGAPAINLG